MIRPSKDEYYLKIAEAVSMRSTCLRKHYGAVLVHPTKGIVATGYNGSPSGEDHCEVCTKVGHGKDISTFLECKSVHAEMNCLINASKDEMSGATLYLAGYDLEKQEFIAAIPCEICFRLLKNSGITTIINSNGTCAERDDTGILRRII